MEYMLAVMTIAIVAQLVLINFTLDQMLKKM